MESIENMLGKVTPFNVMAAYDRLARLTKGNIELCRWTLSSVENFLKVGLYSHQDLRGTAFYGRTSMAQKCLLDVFCVKRDLLNHFLATAGLPPNDIALLQ